MNGELLIESSPIRSCCPGLNEAIEFYLTTSRGSSLPLGRIAMRRKRCFPRIFHSILHVSGFVLVTIPEIIFPILSPCRIRKFAIRDSWTEVAPNASYATLPGARLKAGGEAG